MSVIFSIEPPTPRDNETVVLILPDGKEIPLTYRPGCSVTFAGAVGTYEIVSRKTYPLHNKGQTLTMRDWVPAE